MFPPEIVEHVLSFLSSDLITLRTCFDVFPSLVERIERPHYQSVTVSSLQPQQNDDSTTAIVHRFIYDDAQSSQIAKYIRNIQIVIEESTIQSFYTNHPLLEGYLLSFLPKLSNVESITLASAVESKRNGAQWYMFSGNFFSTFMDCVNQPSVKEVSLRYIRGFPLYAFDNCVNLKSIKVYGRFSDYDEESFPRYRLESGQFTRWPPMQRLSSWAKTNTLHHLSFKLCINWSGDIDRVTQQLQTFSGSLTSLKLDFSESTGIRDSHGLNMASSLPGDQIFTLAHLPHLERLAIYSPVNLMGVDEYLSCQPAILRLIRSLPNRGTRKIHLSVHLQLRSAFNPFVNWTRFITCLFPVDSVHDPIEIYLSVLRCHHPDGSEDDHSFWFPHDKEMQKLIDEGKVVLKMEKDWEGVGTSIKFGFVQLKK